MLRILGSVPGRLKNLFSKFKPYFNKPQFNNFCCAEMGLNVAGRKEHDIVSIKKC